MESARKYHQNQAKAVVDSLGRIINRVNPLYIPTWLLTELYDSYRISQNILSERERDMHDYGEKI